MRSAYHFKKYLKNFTKEEIENLQEAIRVANPVTKVEKALKAVSKWHGCLMRYGNAIYTINSDNFYIDDGKLLYKASDELRILIKYIYDSYSMITFYRPEAIVDLEEYLKLHGEINKLERKLTSNRLTISKYIVK